MIYFINGRDEVCRAVRHWSYSQGVRLEMSRPRILNFHYFHFSEVGVRIMIEVTFTNSMDELRHGEDLRRFIADVPVPDHTDKLMLTCSHGYLIPLRCLPPELNESVADLLEASK